MAAEVLESTIPGGKTPMCNYCGVRLCWDISDKEYLKDKNFWDDWICAECNNGAPFYRRDYYDKRAT